MNIIENVNEKLSFDKEEICAGGEKDIEEIIRFTSSEPSGMVLACIALLPAG